MSDIASLPQAVLDLSLTIALQCVIGWRKQGYTKLQIQHDRSSAMGKHRALWDEIVSPTAPAALVGYGSEGVSFPLGVETTDFLSSESTPGIQIADVVAGAFARHGRWRANDMPETDGYALELDKSLPNMARRLSPGSCGRFRMSFLSPPLTMLATRSTI